MKHISLRFKALFLLTITTVLLSCACGDDDDSMESENCSAGFLMYRKKRGNIFIDYNLCYKIKPPETSYQKYIGCNGNEVDINFYEKSYDIIYPVDLYGDTFWTDYVRHFENGPIVNSINYLTGNSTEITMMDQNEVDMCVTVNVTSQELKITDCEKKFPRLCVVRAERLKLYDKKIPDFEFKYLRRESDKLIFSYSKPVAMSYIKCYNNLFTKQYNVSSTQTLEFELSPKEDDYYWCICTDKWNFFSKPSEKVLFLQDKDQYKRGYAIVIKRVNDLNSCILKKRINTSRVGRMVIMSDIGANRERILLHYFGDLEYLDTCAPLRGNIINITNIFSCPAYEYAPESELGAKVQYTPLCKEYSCIGDFYYGGRWIITDLPYCQPSSSPTLQITRVQKQISTALESSVNVTSLNTVVAMVNKIISFQNDVVVPTEITRNLESLVHNTILPLNVTNVKAIQSKLAIVLAESSQGNQVVGIKVADTPYFTSTSVHILYSDSIIDETENISIFVNVSSIINNISSARLSFVVFEDNKLFDPSKITKNVLNSQIVSIQVDNLGIFNKSKYVDIHFRPIENAKGFDKKICTHWDFELGTTGGWSAEGCELLSAAGPGGLDTCRCYHLTHFAQLISKGNRHISEKDYFILTILSYIGCILSLVGLLIIALTAVVFESWRRDLVHKVWLSLSGAIALMIISMFFVSLFDFHTNNVGLCVLSGVVLHYSVLSTFCWMFVVAMVYFQMTVNVLQAVTYSEYVLFLSANLFGWFIPLFPIVLLFIADSGSYSHEFVTNQPQYEFCYPSGMGWWMTVFLPVLIIIACNMCIFIWIIFSVYSNTRRNGFDGKTLLSFSSVKTLLILFFQFGMVWLFGLLSSNVVMAYLFCILGTMQGMVLCYFFVIGNKKTRNLWLIKLRVRKAEAVPTSEYLFSNRSSSGSRIRSSTTPRHRNTQISEIPLSSIGDNFSE